MFLSMRLALKPIFTSSSFCEGLGFKLMFFLNFNSVFRKFSYPLFKFNQASVNYNEHSFKEEFWGDSSSFLKSRILLIEEPICSINRILLNNPKIKGFWIAFFLTQKIIEALEMERIKD